MVRAARIGHTRLTHKFLRWKGVRPRTVRIARKKRTVALPFAPVPGHEAENYRLEVVLGVGTCLALAVTQGSSFRRQASSIKFSFKTPHPIPHNEGLGVIGLRECILV